MFTKSYTREPAITPSPFVLQLMVHRSPSGQNLMVTTPGNGLCMKLVSKDISVSKVNKRFMNFIGLSELLL